MKIKNNILWKKIHEKFDSVAAFCRANKGFNITPTEVGKLLAFKIPIFKQVRIGKTRMYMKEYRKVCIAMQEALGCPAEVLFPEELYKNLVGLPTSKTVEISSFNALPAPERQKLLFLPAPEEESLASEMELEELRERMGGVLKTLTYREQAILKLRYGLEGEEVHTLEQLGEIFGVTKERIRTVEMRALNKLRHPVRSHRLESFLD